jgi:hypothetical protein
MTAIIFLIAPNSDKRFNYTPTGNKEAVIETVARLKAKPIDRSVTPAGASVFHSRFPTHI